MRVAGEKFKVTSLAELVWWDSVEHDDIETRSAIVRKDLNRDDFPHAIQSGDLLVVVLRQMTCGWAELVGLEGDQRAFGFLPSL